MRREQITAALWGLGLEAAIIIGLCALAALFALGVVALGWLVGTSMP